MNSDVKSRTGGQLVVDVLKACGTDTVFCVPGESYLPVLDALYDEKASIRLIVARQEGGAAYMAEGYGKLTGKPGVCFVTRGPGGTNASIGVHTADQDGTPMVLFIGQVSTQMLGRGAFQEVDFHQMYGAMAKAVIQIDHASRIPELVGKAMHYAVSGRPGPVVVVLPEDVLEDSACVPVPRVRAPLAPQPAAAAVSALSSMLAKSAKPLLLIGGGGWSQEARAGLAEFAQRNDIPVIATFRRQDLMDNRHPCYAGHLGFGVDSALVQRVKEADLLLAVGCRLSEVSTTGYSLLNVPRPHQSMIHVHPGAQELGRVYQADLMIHSGIAGFIDGIKGLSLKSTLSRKVWLKAARQDWVNDHKPVAMPGPLNLSEIVSWLSNHLPERAIIAHCAGNYALWIHRFFRFGGGRIQLAPNSGAMGYGIGAAIAARTVDAENPVICFSGDGGFLMNGQELATAIQFKLKIIFIIVNNSMYGSIRMHQERHFPERVYATHLDNPDFAGLARAYGAHGERVTKTDEFAAAFSRATAADGPTVIELQLQSDAITPRTTISQLRERAKQK